MKDWWCYVRPIAEVVGWLAAMAAFFGLMALTTDPIDAFFKRHPTFDSVMKWTMGTLIVGFVVAFLWNSYWARVAELCGKK